MELERDAEGQCGTDGFTPPGTFAEYVERFPDHLLVMARSIGGYEDAEDLAQSFALKLLKSRAIEKFDPAKTGGCSSGQFFSYVNLCLRRHAATQWRVQSREPSVSHDAIGIDSDVESTATVTEEQIHAVRAVPISAWNPDDAIWLDGFRRWLTEQGYAEYVAVMDAVLTQGTLTDAGEFLRLPSRAIHYRVKKLRGLKREFERRPQQCLCGRAASLM